MKSVSKLKLLAAILSVSFFTACEEDDNPTNPNNNQQKSSIKANLESEARYSRMNEAVEESGESERFEDENSNMTFFATTNAGFDQIFAEYNVSSVAELKAAMGAEVFARFVMYHATEDEVEQDQVSDGDYNTMAEEPNRSNLTVFISKDGSGTLRLNGGEGRGTTVSGRQTIEASNGNIIEVNAVVQAQSNYDYVEDTEDHHNSSNFVQVMLNTDATFKSELQDYDAETTVLLMDDYGLEAVLAVYFNAILDSDDLDALLDANARASLYSKYGVSTMLELMSVVTLDDVINVGARTTADIYAEMDVEDNTELMSYLVFEGYQDFSSQSGNDITARSTTNFNVTATSATDIQLVDDNGNVIQLEGQTAHTANGAVYAVASVQ